MLSFLLFRYLNSNQISYDSSQVTYRSLKAAPLFISNVWYIYQTSYPIASYILGSVRKQSKIAPILPIIKSTRNFEHTNFHKTLSIMKKNISFNHIYLIRFLSIIQTFTSDKMSSPSSLESVIGKQKLAHANGLIYSWIFTEFLARALQLLEFYFFWRNFILNKLSFLEVLSNFWI